MRPALFVIGASRSGSSALAGVMGLLGAGLPATLLGAGPGNERGHFEPQRLLEIHDEVLAAHGATYWDPIAIPLAWFDSVEAAAFSRRIAATLSEEYGNAPLPVIKDPRLCRVAPLYLKAFSLLGLEPRAIIPLRHPGEAARSLAKRDGTHADIAECLQVRELLGAELFSRGMRRTWTGYDHLLTDWQGTLMAISERLGIDWPVPVAEAAPRVEAFLEPGLRRFTAAAPAPLGPLGTRLWAALQAGLAGDDQAVRQEFDAVRAVSAEWDRLHAPWQARILPLAAEAVQIRLSAAEKRAARARFSRRLTGPFRALRRLVDLRPRGVQSVRVGEGR